MGVNYTNTVHFVENMHQSKELNSWYSREKLHIMKEIFQKKRLKTLVTFRKVSHHRLECYCINNVLDKITSPSSKLFHKGLKCVKKAAMF